MSKKIAVIVGSIRKNSYSLQLAQNLIGLLPEGYQAEFVQIDQLPLYNQDYDSAGSPDQYTAFRDQIRSADAVLFVTPEHNRSFPAALKNALDIGSRPYGQSVWNGKPALVVSQSPGNLSGALASNHLRQVLSFLNMPLVGQPEAYIAGFNKLLGEDGKITNQDTLQFLQSVINTFVQLIQRYA